MLELDIEFACDKAPCEAIPHIEMVDENPSKFCMRGNIQDIRQENILPVQEDQIHNLTPLVFAEAVRCVTAYHQGYAFKFRSPSEMCVRLKGAMPNSTRRIVETFYPNLSQFTWVSMEKGLVFKEADL